MNEDQELRAGIGATSLPDLLDAVQEVIWVRERSGDVIYCNGAYATLWGRPMADLESDPRSWISAIHESDRAGVTDALNQNGPDQPFSREYRIVRPDGSLRWLSDRAWPVREQPNAGLRLVGAVQDVSSQKRMETELRTAFDALNSSLNAVILTDPDGRITYANPSFLALFGYGSESEAVGKKAETLFARRDIDAIAVVVNEVAREAAGAREFRVRTKHGSERVVEVMSSDIHDIYGQRIGSMASFIDVTERKMLEQAAEEDWIRLRLLTERLAHTEEQERRRISAQLHDTAVQSFSLANIKLGALMASLKQSSDTATQELQLEKVRALMIQGITECRLIMADLIPPLLYEVGLGAALKEFAERLRNLYQAPISVEEGSTVEVPEALRGVLFQAARELIMNACKHADATRIRVAWRQTSDRLQMEVSDDGKGFDPKEAPRLQPTTTSGFGLLSVQERLRGLGGRLEIHSQPGAGTRAIVRLRLQSA